MATHSRTLAWKIPWMEAPGRLLHPWGGKESDTFHQAYWKDCLLTRRVVSQRIKEGCTKQQMSPTSLYPSFIQFSLVHYLLIRTHSHDCILKMYTSVTPPHQKFHVPITAFSYPTSVSISPNLIFALNLIFKFMQDSSLQTLPIFPLYHRPLMSTSFSFQSGPCRSSGLVIVHSYRIMGDSQKTLSSLRMDHNCPQLSSGLRPEYSHTP